MDLCGVTMLTRDGTVVTELAARGHQDGQHVAPFDLDTMPGTGDLWSTAADLTGSPSRCTRGS